MILIGICTGGTIQSLTVMSLVDLLGSYPESNAMSIQIGGYKPHGMNNLVRDAKQVNATHLLNIDADMTFPPDSIERLLAHDKDIVGANYKQRGNHENQNTPISVTKFIGNDGNYKEVKAEDFPTELFECGAVGLGLTLINMKVFDKLPFPWFRTREDENGHSTEDIVFCQDAREKGFEVWCDPTLNMSHIGTYLY